MMGTLRGQRQGFVELAGRLGLTLPASRAYEGGMKLLLPALLLLAAAGAGWLVLTRSGPTYVPPQEQPTVYAPAPTVLTRPAAAGEEVLALDVEGMCCKSCAGKLHARLLEQPGVRLAAVDFDAGRAEAVVEAGIQAATLAAALTFEKYTARPHAPQ